MAPPLPFRRLRVQVAVGAAVMFAVALSRLAVTLPELETTVRPSRTTAATAPIAGPAPIRATRRRLRTRPVLTTPPRPVATEPEPAAAPMASLKPPTPGTYTYKVSANGLSSADRLLIEPAPVGSTHQTLTDASESRSVTVDWSGVGVTMLAVTQGSNTCKLNVPMVLLPQALSVGLSWRAIGDCNDGAAHIEQDARVRGIAATTVRGERFRCWVISRHTVTTATSPAGTATAESQTEELFSPDLGVVVYRATNEAAPAADGAVHHTGSIVELDAIDVR